MTRHQVLLLTLGLLACTSAYGQSSSLVERGTKRTVEWDDMVGQVVRVDGLAWGAYAKGLGQHLVLPHGQVYVRGVDYSQQDLNGRLLQVEGVLRKARVEAAPPGVQGYGRGFDYFYLDAVNVAHIDQVKYDQLLPAAGDWIVTGQRTAPALEAMDRLGYREYLRALAEPSDGSTAHSFQTRDDEVLLLFDLNGQVKSLTNIKLNDTSRRIDDDYIKVKAYKLSRDAKGPE